MKTIQEVRAALEKLIADGELVPTKEASAISGLTESGIRARVNSGDPDSQPAVPAHGSLFSREQVELWKTEGRRSPGPKPVKKTAE